MIPKIKKVNLSTQLVDTMTTLIEDGSWKLGDNIIYSLRTVYKQMIKSNEVTEVDGKVCVRM